ncbi:MAG TPA: hypothetical protein VIW73_09105 [Candidatus Cybelea sp.]
MLALIVGFAAVYSAFSIIASWIQESIAGAVKLRSKTLISGLEAMLDDPNNKAVVDALRGQLLQQPSIAAAYDSKGRPPSYISSNQFSLAVTGMLGAGGAISATAGEAFTQVSNGINGMQASRLKDALNRVANQAAGDYSAFVGGVEKWFDDEMDRVSGWYRRQSQVILVFIAIATVAFFNLDSITLFSQLRTAPLVIDASKLTDNAQGYTYVTAQVLQNIKFGWFPDPAVCPPAPPPTPAKPAPLPCHKLGDSGDWASYAFFKLLGLAVSALALMLGAPFWFDALGRFVSVRNTGDVPKKSSAGS